MSSQVHTPLVATPSSRSWTLRVSAAVALGVLASCLGSRLLVAAPMLPTSASSLEGQLTVEPNVLPARSSAAPSDAPPDGKVRVELVIPEGFHLWSMNPGVGPQPLVLRLDGSVVPDGPWFGPRPSAVFDRGFERALERYKGTVVFERAVRSRGAVGTTKIVVNVRGQICTDGLCQSEEIAVEAPVEFVDRASASAKQSAVSPPRLEGEALAEAASEIERGEKTGKAVFGAAPGAAAPGAQTDLSAVAVGKAKEEGVLAFIRLAFLLGFLALATPCVFPAIPLTISFFSKYSNERASKSASLAAVYSLAMVGTFTVAGLVISAIFGVTRIQSFAAHPVFNLGLGAVLVFFSLNLLGLFEIETPNFLVVLTNKLETRFGRTRMLSSSSATKQSALADYVVVTVAAVTATTVFFTCTVAFVGIMLVEAAQGQWFWPTIGMLSFASAFSLPFFLLALFPKVALRLRGRGGSWLGSTRVVLGFFELAASFKFLSNADLVWSLGLLSREVVLAGWVALFFVCGLFLLGKVRLAPEPPGQSDAPERGSVLGVLGGIVAFGFSLYLSLGLFGARPFGNWIDGWLPPVINTATHGVSAASGQANVQKSWWSDLERARTEARRSDKLLFLNYTGYTCTNCRYMESAIFPKREIAQLLDEMVVVELYTDNGTPENDANRDDQVQRFGTLALPLYVLEEPDGHIAGMFPGSTNDPETFRRFLSEGLAARRAKSATSGEVGRASEPAQRSATDVRSAAEASRAATPSTAVPPDALARRLSLLGVRLEDGSSFDGVESGRWTLVNFWATYCPPCLSELRGFLARVGHRVEAQGGRFLAVTIDEASKDAEAKAVALKMGLSPSSVVRVDLDSGGVIDPRFKFDGVLPYTVLISPAGDIVWTRSGALDEEELGKVLTQYTGYAILR